MNLKELKHIIDHTVNLVEKRSVSGSENGSEGVSVEIALAEPSIGPLASEEISNVSLGFDWDAGKFMIYGKEPIVRKSYAEKPAIRCRRDGRKISYHCSGCMTIIGKSDKYCKSCGKKLVDSI